MSSSPSICSPDRLDAIRAAHPEIGLALYAIEPGGPVTLEVHTPDGEVYSFRALTTQAAIDQAFPPAAPEPAPAAAPAASGSIFD